MPIGVFVQRSGLTSSALQFYADSGLLNPAEIDPVSGYRYYSSDQVTRATVLRQLREIAVPSLLSRLSSTPGLTRHPGCWMSMSRRSLGTR